MARPSSGKLAAQVRVGTMQKALQQALAVPWRRLEERASAYVEWHIFVLWVRIISEAAPKLPAALVTAVEARCPGFWDDEHDNEQRRPRQHRSIWHPVEEWIVQHHLADVGTEGWFDAAMYYAYKDLRTEKAWNLWERTKEVWRHRRPPRWPTSEEWTAKSARA